MGNWRPPGLRRSQTIGLWTSWPLLEEVTSVLISKSVPRRREKERVEVAHLKSPWHSKWAPYACQQVTQTDRRTLHRARAWVTGSPFTKRCKEKEFPFIYLKISQSLPINRSFNQSLFLSFAPILKGPWIGTSSYQWASASPSEVRSCPYLPSFPNFRWFSTNPAQTDFVSSCTPLPSQNR